jgi:hypothetical protein
MKKLERMSNNGELRFDYPIQRASGQWDALQKSLLIHSIIGDYPIPPIAIVKAEVDGQEGEFVIDGKQRSTTVLDFISGIADGEGNYPATAYPLHDETPVVDIDGKEIELAGLYFDQLDDDAQAEILSATFAIQRMEEATDEQIEELFSRWNNGTPLTKQQKARGKMGTANAIVIDKLLKHPFIQETASFTALQKRRSDDEAVILQTMMLMAKDYEIPSNGFVADNILKFASDMREADISEVTTAVKEALDYANGALEKHPLLKKLHLPTILIVAKKAYDEGVDSEVFTAWVDDFNNAINGRTRDKALVKTNYKNYTGAGSVKRDKVLGRKNAMISHFNEFVDRYVKPIEEEPKKEVVKPQAKKEEKVADLPKEPVKAETTEVDEVFAGLEEVLTK